MLLPQRIQGPDGLLLRAWTTADARVLNQAVSESIEHLRPWMGWIAQEPVSIGARQLLIARWEREWSQGGDAIFGVFLADRVVGGCGLHRRLGPHGLELGYWIHRDFLRRGFATEVARLLTDAALASPDVSYVEIHHDKANVASAGVPRKLGFRLVAEAPDAPAAPAEVGVECRWRLDRRASG